MAERTSSQYAELLRNDFYSFIHRSFLELNPQTPFLPNWHVEFMADKLEDVRLGKCRRLIINIPPRHLKSHAASIAFVAWMLGHAPSCRILCASYAQDISDKLAYDCRRLMTSQFYYALFKTRLSRDRQAVADFETTAGGGRFSSSVTGGTTGRGGDIIILDDPLKANDAYSQVRREGVNEWYDDTLFSRLNDKQNGAIVLIMQRLHSADLVAHILKKEPWDVVSFPAIATEREVFDLSTPFGVRRICRDTRDVLHVERESQATLDVIRRSLGEAKFQAQYQQTPVPPGGIHVKPQWFKTYVQAPTNPDMIFQSWDTASKIEERNDFSVCTTWVGIDKHLFLIDVFRAKLEVPDLKRAIERQNALFNPNTILIEDSASGTGLIQQLRRDGLTNISGVSVQGNKEMRFAVQTPQIEGGFVHLPREADWLQAYVTELTAFPNWDHDDQVDSTSNALDWFATHGNFRAQLRYYSGQALEEEYITKNLVRVRLPPGRCYNIPADIRPLNGGEEYDVSEEAAEILCRPSNGGVRVR